VVDARTDPDEFVQQMFVDLHRALLGLAGRMPDDAVTELRRQLGMDLAYLADSLVAFAAELGVPLTRAGVDAARAMIGPERDPAGLDLVTLVDAVPETGHRFTPVPPAVLDRAGDRIPPVLDLTGGQPEELIDLPPELAHLTDLANDLTDPTDDAVVFAMADRPGTVGVWRAWRTGPEAARRVYLVEVDPGLPAWDWTYQAQRALKDEDESPQVEVYWTGEELPPYHRAALAGAALLWARTPGRVRLAPVAGRVDAAGRPVFGPDHPRLPAGPGRDGLLARLRAGAPVPAAPPTTVDAVDAVEPARGAVVPPGHRTDGRWAWPEAAAYYLGEYGLSPDPELVEHLRAAAPAVVDGPGLFRARAAVASGGPGAAGPEAGRRDGG
jgi:hypothetical protein